MQTVRPLLVVFVTLLVGVPAQSQLVIDTVGGGASEDGMPAVSSHVSIESAAACPDGKLYVAGSSRLYALGGDGILHLVAGNGTAGYSGDGGPAKDALFIGPQALACDAKGNIYLSDDARIRRIDRAGIIRTVAGNGLLQSSATNGSALSVPTDRASSLAIGQDGSIYFCYRSRVSVLRPDGTIALVAGAAGGDGYDDGDNGKAVDAHLGYAASIALDSSGNLYIQDTGVVRKVSPDGVITTPIGGGVITPYVEGMDASKVNLLLKSMVVLADDTLVVTSDLGSFSAYRITPDNKVSTVSGITANILCADPLGDIFYGANSGTLWVRRPDGLRAIAVGGATFEYPDGTPAKSAAFSLYTMAVDKQGRVLFGDGCKIRRINADGRLETLAGTGACGPPIEGSPALSTTIPAPNLLAAAGDGSIFFLGGNVLYKIEPAENRVQVIDFQGNILSLAADSVGNVYLISGQYVIRIAPSGVNTTLLSPVGTVRFIRSLVALTVDPATDTVYTMDLDGGLFEIPPGGNPVLVSDNNYLYQAVRSLAISGGAVWFANYGELERVTNGISVPVGVCCRIFGDGGPAQSAGVFAGTLASDRAGSIYMAGGGRIRKVSGSLPSKPPAIGPGGVVNSASYSNASFAAGEIISIFGEGLAYATLSGTVVNNSLAGSLSHTTVLVNGNNASVALLSVSPQQLNVILPQPSLGSVRLEVEVDGVLSNSVILPISAAAPGLYTADGSGKGPAAAINQDGTVNSALNPAQAGTIVSFYGTGAGNMSPELDTGYLAVSPPWAVIAGPVHASVAGQSAEVLYSGAAPFLASGAFQLNLRVPAGTPAGAAPVAVTISAVPANDVLLWVG